jgi:hypothetical protein
MPILSRPAAATFDYRLARAKPARLLDYLPNLVCVRKAAVCRGIATTTIGQDRPPGVNPSRARWAPSSGPATPSGKAFSSCRALGPRCCWGQRASLVRPRVDVAKSHPPRGGGARHDHNLRDR